MSTPSSPAATASASATSRPNPRQAALLAAEARLRPASSSSSSNPATTSPESAVASASGSSTPPLFQSGGNGASAGTRKWTPTEKEERDCRIKFARLLDRGLVRDNGYRQVADGVETLLLIANNIIQHDDPKYRTLKATNGMLKNKVLSLKGGHEYLIALGFRTQTVDFNQIYVFTSTLKSAFELRIGTQVLSDHLSDLQTRAANAAASALAHKQAESSRVAQALAQIEADRDDVKVRRQREAIMRGRDDRLKREEREKREREEEEMERRREEAERMGHALGAGTRPAGGMSLGGGGTAGGASIGGGAVSLAAVGDEDQADDEDDDYGEEEEDAQGAGYNGYQSGQGRRLAD